VIVVSGLILALLIQASPLKADYLLTLYDGKTVQTRSYWIQADKLFLSDSPGSLNAYDVKSVSAENLAPDEAKAHDAAMAAFRSQTEALLASEKGLAASQEEFLKKISAYPVGRKNAIPKADRKALRAGLTDLRSKVSALLDDWRNAKVPDLSLVKIRDIKVVQLISLDASLAQALMFVGRNDPSYFAYARADLDQYAAFEETFREALPWK
jgi:hypothetical protein